MAPPPSELMIQVIGKIPLFKDFSPTQVRLVLGMCEHRVMEAEQVICRTGAIAEEMYILVAGELEKVTSEGLTLEEILPVMAVGEMEMLTGRRYACTVQAIKASHIFSIPRSQFERMLRRDMDVELKVYKNLSELLVGQMEEGGEQRAERRREEEHFQARIATLERQVRHLGQKVEVAVDLLVGRGQVSRDEAEYYIADRLKDLVPRVLVVDDEPEFRRFVKEALSACMVVEAQSGREALEIVHEERLDLIIADIRMPEMDGCTLLTNLRGKFPGVPVLAVSGYLGAEDLQNYGFDGFIDKPVGPHQLQRLVEVALMREN